MISKIQFALFFPAFFLLYFAGSPENAVLGLSGVLILVTAALLGFVAKKKK